MGRFDTIVNNFAAWGNNAEELYAAVVIGSQARENNPADDFSDMDIIMVVEEPKHFLDSDKWLEQIGDVQISFTEDTIGGGKERRVLFDNALDVDFLVLSRKNFEDGVKGGDTEILSRGYRVLIDKIGFSAAIPSVFAERPPYIPPTEDEFTNLTNDFWFHAVWASKKLIRGELWTAKGCVDSYMKGMLFTLIECHAHVINGMDYDAWHGGRFLDKWAESWIVEKLPCCYAHYDSDDIKNALLSTMELWRLIATQVAEKLGYKYPTGADRYSASWVMSALSDLNLG